MHNSLKYFHLLSLVSFLLTLNYWTLLTSSMQVLNVKPVLFAICSFVLGQNGYMYYCGDVNCQEREEKVLWKCGTGNCCKMILSFLIVYSPVCWIWPDISVDVIIISWSELFQNDTLIFVDCLLSSLLNLAIHFSWCYHHFLVMGYTYFNPHAFKCFSFFPKNVSDQQRWHWCVLKTSIVCMESLFGVKIFEETDVH